MMQGRNAIGIAKWMTWLFIGLWLSQATQVLASENANATLVDTTKIKELLQKVTHTNNLDSAYGYVHQALQWANQLDEPGWIGRSLSLLGRLHYMKGRYQESIDTSKLAITYLEKASQNLQYQKLISRRNIAICLVQMGQFEEALMRLEQIADLARAYDRPKAEATAYLTLGVVNAQKDRIGTALYYFIRTAIIAEKIKANYLLAPTYNNIAKTYGIIQQYDCALEYYHLADSIYTAFREQPLYSGKSHVGFTYVQLEEYEKGEVKLLEALEIVEKSADQTAMIDVYLPLAELYVELGKLEKSGFYLQKMHEAIVSAQLPPESQKARRYDRLYAYTKAKLLGREKNYQEAIALLDTLLKDLALFPNGAIEEDVYE
ncbi:MAG: tetratricopeptide repeat protein, partial [Bacteroidota bacterium]